MEDLTQGSVTKHLLRFCSGMSCGKGFASTNRKISFLPARRHRSLSAIQLRVALVCLTDERVNSRHASSVTKVTTQSHANQSPVCA